MRRDDESPVLHQQRVAVGLGALDDVGRDGTVAAALVVHHHGLAQHRRSAWAAMRPEMSVVPPAAAGTTNVTVLLG